MSRTAIAAMALTGASGDKVNAHLYLVCVPRTIVLVLTPDMRRSSESTAALASLLAVDITPIYSLGSGVRNQ